MRERGARSRPAARAAAPWSWRGPALLVALLAAAVFAPALWNGFTSWDDTVYTVNNANLKTLAGLGRIWTSLENEQYYPLTWTLNWCEYQLFGAHAAGYHAVSIVLHALNAALLVVVLRALGFARIPAVAAACLWAVHPTHVMSVAWVAERKNQLSLVFVLLTVLLWIAGNREKNGRLRWAAVATFALALMAKSQIIALPIALVVLDHRVLGRPWKNALVRILPMLALCAISVVVTRIFEDRYLDPYTLASMPPFPERVQIAGGALWYYAYKSLVPWPLAPFYPLWSASRTLFLWWLPVLAAAVTIVLLARNAARIDGRLLFGSSLFALMLAPILGLLPYANLPLTFVSDHYLYAALAGLALPAALCFEHALLRTRPARPTLALLFGFLFAFFVVRTESYVPVFHDPESFWGRTLEVSPDSYAGHVGMAEALSRSGRFRDALPHYERAVELRPDWIDAYQMLGAAQVRSGDLSGAEQSLQRALELSPNNVNALCSLAEVQERRGKPQIALETFERAVALEGQNRSARMGLARMYVEFGRHAEAESQLRAVLAREPANARAWLGLATCERGLGHDADACASVRAGLEHAPGDVDLRNMLAWISATSRDDRVRNGHLALQLAQAVNAETNFVDHELLDTLAAALAENGRFDEALDVARKAGERAAQHGETLPKGERERRVEAYTQHRPWRT